MTSQESAFKSVGMVWVIASARSTFKLEQVQESASKGAEGERDVTTRTTRTIITRTTYGGDGEPSMADTKLTLADGSLYDTSDSLGDVVLGSSSYGSAISSSRLDKAQDDLSSYKKRIDANVEQQREHSDMMAALQRKVQEYRRRFADIEGRLAAHKPDEGVTFNIHEVKEEWGPKMMIKGLEDSEYEFLARLDEERRKNEEFRMLLEQERIQNEQLQNEIQHLRQQFELSLRDKERVYQNRERNLTQYLSEEQRKMMDLWAELQQVRRQCAEYKEQTERDLENQKNEFIKVMRSIGGVARQLNLSAAEGGGAYPLFSDTSSESGTVINQDTVLVEAVKRFRDQQTTPGGPLYGRRLHKNTVMKRSSRYEESIEHIIELESRGDGSAGKVSNLEAELKRTKDRLAECLETLRKLHNLAKESSPDADKATGSIPPGSTQVVPSEVLRSVRYAIRSRDNELQQLQRKLKNTETQINELEIQYEGAEEARKRLEKQLATAKKDIASQTKALDDANREVKRLEERLSNAESEKNVSETARKHLEDEIRRLKIFLDQTATDGERKALEDAEERIRQVEDEYKTRMTDLTHRIEGLQNDNKRLRAEYNSLKDKYRNIEIDYNNTVRKIDEKDAALKNLETIKGDLMRDLEKERARVDAVTSELDNLQASYTTTTKNTLVIETSIKEIKQQRDELVKQKDDLNHQLQDIKAKMDIEIRKREELEKTNQLQLGELEKLKTDILEYESQTMMIRRHNDELDTQTKTLQAKIVTLENSLTSAQRELEKLTELNNKLQKEKQDVMNLKQKSDASVDALKDRVRKLEQEVDKLRMENTALHDSEQKTKDAYKEMANKAHLLEKELEDTKNELDELRKRLNRLDQENREKIELTLMTKAAPDEKTKEHRDTVSTYESTHIHEVRVKELGDRYKLDLDKLENDRDELGRRVRALEDELAEKQRNLDRQEADIEDLKRKHQLEIDRLRAELASLQTKYQNDLEDERDQNNHDPDVGGVEERQELGGDAMEGENGMNIEVMKATEEDLRNKLAAAEKRLQDVLEKQKVLEKDNADWEDKYQSLIKDLLKLRDELDRARNDAEKEIQKWKTDCYTAQTDLKTAEASNEALKTQLNTANDRISSLNKTINEQSAKIRELNSQVHRLEEELEDAKSTVASHEADLDDTLNRLHALEDQYASLQLENSKLRNEADSLLRELDVLKSTHASDESEIERLKKKLQYVTDAAKEQADELHKVKDERDQLEKAYREKSKQVDQLKELAQTFDVRMNRMRQEVQDASDKLITADADRNALRNELKKLQQELQFGKEQMHRKTDEFHAALEDLSNAHRAAEDGRVNAIQELETKKYEVSDLQARLDNAEQRLTAVQQEYITADNERSLLADSLRRFQSAVNRTITISRFQQIANGGKGDEIVLEHPDETIKKEIVTHVQASPGHGVSVADAIDLHGLDINIQKLISRIEKLERERNEYRDSLGRLKRKTSDSHVTINKHETLYKSIEEKFNDAEEDRRALEVRLASAKQLLRSQEEALKQRDDERRQLKSKIVAFELQARGKEAQIRHLNELVKTLRTDMENAQAEARSLRDHEELWDTSKFKLESKMRDHEGESQRVSMLMSSFESERQSLNESVKKLASQLQTSEGKNADLRDDLEKLKRDLAKAESIEMDLRRSLEEKTRIAQDASALREQLNIAQNDLMTANSRKQQLENELMTVRSELREQKQHLNDTTNRLSDLQRQLLDAQNEKNRLNDKLYSLEKTVTQHRANEGDLRQQLSVAASEKKGLQNEIDELRRRISQFESDRRDARDKLDELNRVRIALLKKIEVLEAEKRKAEAVISETAVQREAIEHSLSALERENKELYKNSAQLQQQIAQLEMDSGNRLIALTNRQREEHDRFVQSVKNEKAQFERIVENRDRTQKNRIKQLENQLNIMREQLNNERRRRRDATDRVLINDMSKLSSKMFGLNTAISSAGGYYPQTDLDYIGSRGSYSSYGMSPRMDFASLGAEYYRAPTSSVAFKEPVDIAQDTYSYRATTTLGTMMSDGVSSKLEPAREIEDSERRKKTVIVVHMKGAHKDIDSGKESVTAE
ncbi:Spindle- and centromere-associated protein [Toxocara canis]|uniref:Spindle-and centromere-associated protein n=1 Tax=Toxocara canis TaxID=6265 RepID=A0A0B2VVR8_TOXCA|nr:Spindle- and centromere-associated protein [Toxocara canis]